MRFIGRLAAVFLTLGTVVGIAPDRAAALLITPSPIDFGEVVLGTTATQQITLAFDDPGFFLFPQSSGVLDPSSPFSFAADAACESQSPCAAIVSFTPTQLGLATGELFVLECSSIADPPTCNPGFADLRGAGVEATVAVPEPMALAVLGAGLLGLGVARRRRAIPGPAGCRRAPAGVTPALP